MPNNGPIKPKFDFSGIDTTNIDPDRLPIGTKQQDCSLIAQTFERGCHSTPSEAAVFATLTRNLQNNKSFAKTASESLSTYLNSPTDSASEAASQSQKFASDAVPNPGGTDGTSSQNDQILQGFNIGTQSQSINTDSFGDKLMDWARDCIPCSLRLAAFLELHPNIDLLGSLEGYLEGLLGQLTDITGMLKNFDSYGDFCQLLNLLSFMCVPDLQRIISLLMALFMLQVPKLDGLIGLLQGLIAPIFAPILMAITSLLDQFSALVTAPLACVIDAINAQIEKLTVETNSSQVSFASSSADQLQSVSSGLQQLGAQVTEGVLQVKNKLKFYVDQVRALIDEMGGNDSAYIQAKIQVLQLVRMISFVTAIITALSKGHAACSSQKTPENQELDNFFNNFLNPNSPFNMWVDDNGQIHLDEKIEGFDSAVKPPNTGEALPQFGNVLQFEGEDLLQLDPRIETLATELASSIEVVIPCKLEKTVGDTDKVNQWLAELNKQS